MKSINKYNIRVETLLRIFKEFKRNPKKIFVAKDSFKSSPKLFAQRYLDTLIKLGLIEKFNVIYYCGIKKSIRGDTKGYRLKRGRRCYAGLVEKK